MSGGAALVGLTLWLDHMQVRTWNLFPKFVKACTVYQYVLISHDLGIVKGTSN